MKRIRQFFASSVRRRILAGFVIVGLMAMVMTVATFLELNQVRAFSQQVIPSSSQVGHLQGLALATSALDADLERYLVIRGAEYHDTVLQDLDNMSGALTDLRADADSTALSQVQQLEDINSRLQPAVNAILDAAATDINQRTVVIYNDIDQIKQVQQNLSAATLNQLQATAIAQENITSSVIVQLIIVGLIVTGFAIAAALFIDRSLRPIGDLTATATAIAGGDLSRTVAVRSTDEIGVLAQNFNTMTERLRDTIGSLEARVEMRTEQLRTSADVGRTAASVLEPDELLNRVVSLITDRFGFYYAAVFIIDSSGHNAVLREATGEAGRILKERGHKLEVNGQSMVGYAITRRRPRIALDVGEEAVRFANPLLPDTRSEIALPLMVGDQVLGALDVQSTQEAAFDEASAAMLQSMADQIAIAWQNALSYTETEAVARRSRALYAASREVSRLQADLADTIRVTMRAAAEIMEYGRWCVLTFNEIRTALVSIADHNWPEAVEELDVQTHLDHPLVICLQQDADLFITEANDVRLRDLHIDDLRGLIGVPIKTRDTIVGVLAFGRTRGREFTEGDLEIGHSLANLIAVAIENHNLVETSQRTLHELDEINRSLTGQAWERFVRRQEKREIIWVSQSDQLQPQQLPEVNEALTQGHIATRTLDDVQQLGVAVPIKLRDVPVGALRLILPRHTWNLEMAAALDSIAGHVAQAAENARLIAETEERLVRERALADATEKVRQQNEVETILQTAATELARYLNASHIAVRMTPEGPVSDGDGR